MDAPEILARTPAYTRGAKKGKRETGYHDKVMPGSSLYVVVAPAVGLFRENGEELLGQGQLGIEQPMVAEYGICGYVGGLVFGST